MTRALLAALLAVAPAAAADRTVAVASFDRVRVEGPFAVEIVTGRSPSARIEGDARGEAVDVALTGSTLVVRRGSGGWGERPRGQRQTGPVRVRLATPQLRALVVNAGGEASVAPMKGQRIDLALTGAGSISAGGIAADELNATLVGTGTLKLAGRSQRARLQANGAGAIDADALAVRDLTVRTEGSGETRARATMTAQVTSSGLGRVTVAGGAKCVVRAISGGPVDCGVQAPR